MHHLSNLHSVRLSRYFVSPLLRKLPLYFCLYLPCPHRHSRSKAVRRFSSTLFTIPSTSLSSAHKPPCLPTQSFLPSKAFAPTTRKCSSTRHLNPTRSNPHSAPNGASSPPPPQPTPTSPRALKPAPSTQTPNSSAVRESFLPARSSWLLSSMAWTLDSKRSMAAMSRFPCSSYFKLSLGSLLSQKFNACGGVRTVLGMSFLF
jgi:hypothetical protein